MTLPEELRRLAVDLARGAGKILLGARYTELETKSSPTDPVTDADRAAERYIFDRLRSERPMDSILAEEGSRQEGPSGITWVVDPLDGTVNYVYDIPQWAVSIGVEGNVRAGVIHDPSKDEMFTDADDLRPSQKTDLSQALVGTGFAYSSKVRERQAAVAARVIPQVRDIRRAGSCALDLAWVADGRLDAFYEESVNSWDISAGIAIIQAAGGHVILEEDLIVAAGNTELAEKLRALVV